MAKFFLRSPRTIIRPALPARLNICMDAWNIAWCRESISPCSCGVTWSAIVQIACWLMNDSCFVFLRHICPISVTAGALTAQTQTTHKKSAIKKVPPSTGWHCPLKITSRRHCTQELLGTCVQLSHLATHFHTLGPWHAAWRANTRRRSPPRPAHARHLRRSKKAASRRAEARRRRDSRVAAAPVATAAHYARLACFSTSTGRSLGFFGRTPSTRRRMPAGGKRDGGRPLCGVGSQAEVSSRRGLESPGEPSASHAWASPGP